ncbi:hypothetical protein D4S03_04860 [bacterium]|nr:MAG: hypothetical protein D4S03_04860 [bacterium]
MKILCKIPAACRGAECMPSREGDKGERSAPLILTSLCGFSHGQPLAALKMPRGFTAGSFT